MNYNNYYYQTEKWLQLYEAVDYNHSGTIYPYTTPINWYNVINNYITIMTSRWYKSNGQLVDYAEELLNMIYARYWTHYIGKENSEREHIIKLTNIFTFTYDKYAKLLKLYKDEENHLMDTIKSSAKGVSRFNDTPQDGGMYDDDEHTSNITQTSGTSETDANTKIVRLEEIAKLYRNLMFQWTREFDQLYIEEMNV